MHVSSSHNSYRCVLQSLPMIHQSCSCHYCLQPFVVQSLHYSFVFFVLKYFRSSLTDGLDGCSMISYKLYTILDICIHYTLHDVFTLRGISGSYFYSDISQCYKCLWANTLDFKAVISDAVSDWRGLEASIAHWLLTWVEYLLCTHLLLAEMVGVFIVCFLLLTFFLPLFMRARAGACLCVWVRK